MTLRFPSVVFSSRYDVTNDQTHLYGAETVQCFQLPGVMREPLQLLRLNGICTSVLPYFFYKQLEHEVDNLKSNK